MAMGANPVHENRSVIAAQSAIQFHDSGISTCSGPRLSPGWRVRIGRTPRFAPTDDFHDKCSWRGAPPPGMKIGQKILPTAHCPLFSR